MSPRDRFQYDVATGRWSLPVVALVTLAVWVLLSGHPLAEGGVLLCVGVTAYMLAELNTLFMLIRTRTALPSCLFLCLFVSTFFLYRWEAGSLFPVLFCSLLFALFRSYESYHASATIFHAFFFLSLCSCIIPYFFWLFPLLFLHMAFLRSFSARTFFAGIIGMLVPYWLVLGYHLCMGSLDDFFQLAVRPFRWAMPDYDSVSLLHGVACGVMLFLFIAYMVFYYLSAYKDKVQTRILLKTVVWMGIWVWSLIAIHPQSAVALLPVAFIPTSVLGGRLYALSFSLYVRISFYVTQALLLFLFLFGLWMHLFSF